MSLEQNKAIARRHFDELWTNGALAVADDIYSPATVGHCGNLPDQTGYPECEKELVRQDLVAFPDGVATVEDQIAEGDKVATRWVGRGTHQGELMGVPASGNRVEITGTTVYRISGGKIAETWTNYDMLGMMQQIGAVPSPGQQS